MKKEKGIGLVAFIIIFVAILIIGAVAVVLFMTGDKDNEKTDDKVAIKDSNTKTEVNIKEDKEEFDVTKWGVQESIVSVKNDKFGSAYIKFPTLSGITRGTGKLAYQKDETLVILDAEHKEVFPNITANSFEDVFPAYFEQTRAIIDAYRQMNYDNFEFSVSEKETVIVNGYEMCKFKGKHTYTVKDVNTFEIENIEINYVAYATQLKTNGAYVYWMVLDESEDQSLTKTIEDYAYKMALSLKES